MPVNRISFSYYSLSSIKLCTADQLENGNYIEKSERYSQVDHRSNKAFRVSNELLTHQRIGSEFN